MTSSPPSETGATAEEVKATRWIVAFLTNHGVECAVTYEEPENCTCAWGFFHVKVAERIAHLVAAAKRSAHLEDARAGCEFCAGDEGIATGPEKRDGWSGWWHRGSVAGSQRNFFKCKRPEVWDALSRTGAK